jgi:hypothetical protein
MFYIELVTEYIAFISDDHTCKYSVGSTIEETKTDCYLNYQCKYILNCL